MSKHETATLICRSIAVYIIASAAVGAGTTAVTVVMPAIAAVCASARSCYVGARQVLQLSSAFLPALIQLLVGMILWRKASSVADRIVATT